MKPWFAALERPHRSGSLRCEMATPPTSVLRVRGKGGKVVLIPLPPAVARAIDQAVGSRDAGPILRNIHGARMDRHAATRRLKHLADTAGIRLPRMHPHMLRHTFRHHMLDAGVSPPRRTDRGPPR